MKNQANAKRRQQEFEEGEWVFVKLRPHRQLSVANRVHAKLAARYYGPYPIIARIGAVAYRLQLPAGSRVHPVFHTSLLKKAVGNYSVESELPDQLDGEELPQVQPISVLAHRNILRQGASVPQVLVHWQGKSAEEATWEDMLTIQSQFPTFNLEDKVDSSGGGIVGADTRGPILHNQSGPREWKVYSRRRKRGSLCN